MNLSDQEKEKIKGMIERGEPLPPKYRLLLFADAPEVELVWQGKSSEVTNIVLPFQSIEQIDEPRKDLSKQQLGLFSIDAKKGRQSGGWSNKLIWGDNKLVLSSLKNGPLRREIEAEGGLKLVYIDPPFDVGADFSFNINVGDEDTFTKEPSVIEEIAYRDTWGRGTDSYISMVFERLHLIRDLLHEDGSILVHVGDKVAAEVRLILNEIFGLNNYRNTIVIPRGIKNVQAQFEDVRALSVGHDVLLFYSKSEDTRIQKLTLPGAMEENGKWDTFWRGTDRPTMRYEIFGQSPRTGQWRWGEDRALKAKVNFETFLERNAVSNLDQYYLDELEKGNELNFLRLGPDNSVQYFVPPRNYKLASTLWTSVRTKGTVTEYATEKNEELLQVILNWLTKENDLVADFFCGSGTTIAVAQKLGRKWIGCDLGRFAIHTARKRLISVQRELKIEEKPYRSFEILNLGKYERQYFVGVNPNLPEDERKAQSREKEEHYLDLILNAYKAEKLSQYSPFHGKKGGVLVFVGPIDSPVTLSQVNEIIDQCQKKTISKVDILGFEFEMGLAQFVQDEAKQKGVGLSLKFIPKDVFDRRAIERGQVQFYDVAYVEILPKVEKQSVTVTLKDFGVFYRQEDLEATAESLKPGGSKVIVESGQVVKVWKDKKGTISKDVLTKKWTDWIDYWAVDFHFEDKREIIRILEDGQEKEVWTGNYIFENEWQSFRTRKDRNLELTSGKYEYPAKGKYKIAVKVIDIFGNDTTKAVDVKV